MGVKKQGSTSRQSLSTDDLHPVVLMEDRYLGAYSKGAWLAIGMADAPISAVDLEETRAMFCLEDGPNGSDEEAAKFWTNRPDWIASGNTPQEALNALLSNP